MREVGARTEEIPILSRLPSRVLRGARGVGALPGLPSMRASLGSWKELMGSVGNFPVYPQFYKVP